MAGRQPLHVGACPRKLAGQANFALHTAHTRRCIVLRGASLSESFCSFEKLSNLASSADRRWSMSTSSSIMPFKLLGAMLVRSAAVELGSRAHNPAKGRGSGSQRSVCRSTGSGQIQCTSPRNFAPFTTSTFTDMHPPPHVSLTCILLTEKLCSFYHLDIHRHSRERAGKKDRGGSAVSARYIVTCILLLIVRGRYDTTQTLSNKDIKRAYEAWDSPCTVSGRLQSGAFRGVAALGQGSRLGSLSDY